jgi:hypothetical protein
VTGRIIPFQSCRNCEHASLRRPSFHFDHPSASIRSQMDFGSPSRNPRILKLQIARVAKLLDELEQFARTTENLPPTIAGQTHAGIEGARIILQPFSGCDREAGWEDDIEADPQPEIDGEMLERMYRELNPDA